jgi:8-amino-7-oxononanoate synthase
MTAFDEFMQVKLNERVSSSSKRKLALTDHLIDFSSNDYLGIALKNNTGSSGSRLISGNSIEAEQLEKSFSNLVGAEKSLFFSSGYQANIGLIPALTDRNSTIIYDEYIHASLRDGIQLSHAKSYSYRHNDLDQLQQRLEKAEGRSLIITESVFSMDGDSPNLEKLVEIAKKHNAGVLLDEAHSFGITGSKGKGLVSELGIHNELLAVVYPLGKAVGTSGAFVTGNHLLREYLINFCRSFIYSTAPSKTIVKEVEDQLKCIADLYASTSLFELKNYFINHLSEKHKVITGPYSAIVSVMIPGNDKVKNMEQQLIKAGIFGKSIMHPTVPKGEERLRICFHDFNSKDDVDLLIGQLNQF